MTNMSSSNANNGVALTPASSSSSASSTPPKDSSKYAVIRLKNSDNLITLFQLLLQNGYTQVSFVNSLNETIFPFIEHIEKSTQTLANYGDLGSANNNNNHDVIISSPPSMVKNGALNSIIARSSHFSLNDPNNRGNGSNNSDGVNGQIFNKSSMPVHHDYFNNTTAGAGALTSSSSVAAAASLAFERSFLSSLDFLPAGLGAHFGGVNPPALSSLPPTMSAAPGFLGLPTMPSIFSTHRSSSGGTRDSNNNNRHHEGSSNGNEVSVVNRSTVNCNGNIISNLFAASKLVNPTGGIPTSFLAQSNVNNGNTDSDASLLAKRKLDILGENFLDASSLLGSVASKRLNLGAFTASMTSASAVDALTNVTTATSAASNVLSTATNTQLRQRGQRGYAEDPSLYVTCRLCKNKIMGSRISNLTNHVRRHSSLKQFQCCYCEYTHNEMAKVRLHMLHNHKDKDSQPIDNLSPEMQTSWEYLMKECFPEQYQNNPTFGATGSGRSGSKNGNNAGPMWKHEDITMVRRQDVLINSSPLSTFNRMAYNNSSESITASSDTKENGSGSPNMQHSSAIDNNSPDMCLMLNNHPSAAAISLAEPRKHVESGVIDEEFKMANSTDAASSLSVMDAFACSNCNDQVPIKDHLDHIYSRHLNCTIPVFMCSLCSFDDAEHDKLKLHIESDHKHNPDAQILTRNLDQIIEHLLPQFFPGYIAALLDQQRQHEPRDAHACMTPTPSPQSELDGQSPVHCTDVGSFMNVNTGCTSNPSPKNNIDCKLENLEYKSEEDTLKISYSLNENHSQQSPGSIGDRDAVISNNGNDTIGDHGQNDVTPTNIKADSMADCNFQHGDNNDGIIVENGMCLNGKKTPYNCPKCQFMSGSRRRITNHVNLRHSIDCALKV